ncbi:MAG: hypothetical protein J5950_09135 [Clostridia bacterium]|nr:hypothetical protein [Clostridia bacterium]
MRRTITRFAAAVLTAALLACSFPAALAAGPEETEQSENTAMYAFDPADNVHQYERDWDLLYDAYINGGVINGYAVTESTTYGFGFRHAAAGSGTSSISFKIKMPEGKTAKYVQIGIRLNDYTDVPSEQKGLFICVNSEGKLGIPAVKGSRIEGQLTGYSFVDGRKICVEDDADANAVTVYFEDGGEMVKIARLGIDGGRVTVNYENETLSPVTVDYGREIYKSGYISVYAMTVNTVFTDVSVTLPIETPVKTDEEPQKQQSETPEKPSRKSVVLWGIAALIPAAAIAISAILLIKDKKKSVQKTGPQEEDQKCE